MVLMTNCFLAQSISISCVHLMWFYFVFYYMFQIYLHEIWNNLQNNCQFSSSLSGLLAHSASLMSNLVNWTWHCFIQEKCLKPHLVMWFWPGFWNDLKRDPSTSVSFPSIDDIRDSPFDDRRFLLNNQYKVYFTLLGKYYEIMIVKHIILDMSFAAVKETQRSSLSSTLRIINRGKYWSYDYPLLGPMPPSGRRT